MTTDEGSIGQSASTARDADREGDSAPQTNPSSTATSETLATLGRSLKSVYKRLNLLALQHAFYVAASIIVAALGLLIIAATSFESRSFSYAFRFALLLMASAAAIFGILLRRNWHGPEEVIHFVDREAQLADRVASATSQEASSSSLFPILVGQLESQRECWQPTKLVPRRVPRSVLALIAAVAALTAITVFKTQDDASMQSAAVRIALAAQQGLDEGGMREERESQWPEEDEMVSSLDQEDTADDTQDSSLRLTRMRGTSSNRATQGVPNPDDLIELDPNDGLDRVAKSLQEMIRDALNGSDSESGEQTRNPNLPLDADELEARSADAESLSSETGGDPSGNETTAGTARAGATPPHNQTENGASSSSADEGAAGHASAGQGGSAAGSGLFAERSDDALAAKKAKDKIQIQLAGSSHYTGMESQEAQKRSAQEVSEVGFGAPTTGAASLAQQRQHARLIRKVPIAAKHEKLLRHIFTALR